ncbi:PREDICTED: uncharacterized protein LOC109173575 [Ipomoea nil]|uniref:uncharacterized protein LOC109173575 n=1 Tax=Ipomoea nil TaxID=35883 RepID=UPI00090086B5|nr:PREDICTED: uncharacterized protein LOC109173575 [Ipomoea nil]
MGMNIDELATRRYLFKFYHEADISRIINDGPWTFDKSLLLLKRLSDTEDPLDIDLNTAEFWVQVHGLPPGFRSEAVLRGVGDFIGVVYHCDERNFDGSTRSFFRIRITIDVTKPLKKGMRLKKEDGDWIQIEFRYERLPTFCFICGLLGHSDKFCNRRVQGWDPLSEKTYGSELRAGFRRNIPTGGNR